VKEKRKNTQAVRTIPPINERKGATLVLGNVKLLHQKKKVNGDQEGCSLDLKLPPDESL